jgi:hypothetical protein
MTTTINASTTAGLVNTADTSGVLALQTAGTTAVTVNASQVVSIGTTNIGGTLNTTTTSGNWGEIVYDLANNAAMLAFRNNAGSAAGDISLSSAGATSLLISNVAGVNFPATQVASANANTLDDYEEGTWTPNQGTGLTVIGTFSSLGGYTKVGRQVTVYGYVSATGSIALAGAGQLCSNLPFTQGDPPYAVATLQNTDNIVGGAFVLAAQITASSALAAASNIKFSVTYFV